MRRSASEVVRNLEMRVAHLERQASLTPYPQTKIHDPRIDMEVIEWSFGDIGKIMNEHPSTGELETLSAKSLERALKDTHMLIQELIGKGRLEDAIDRCKTEIKGGNPFARSVGKDLCQVKLASPEGLALSRNDLSLDRCSTSSQTPDSYKVSKMLERATLECPLSPDRTADLLYSATLTPYA